MIGQVGYAGLSSSESVTDKYQTAVDACEQNKSLQRESVTLNNALAVDLATSAEVANLAAVADSWQGQITYLNNYSVNLRKHYLLQYTIFLGFLTFITFMLFFALEKKGGRLDRLFDKIDRIKASTT